MSLHNIRLVPIPDKFAIAKVEGLIPNIPRNAEIANVNVVNTTRSEKRSKISLTELGPISANRRKADINYCADEILLQGADHLLYGTTLITYSIKGRV